MYVKYKKAFTMLELLFVIVIIGILATVAIPKFVITRGDAVVTKAKTTVASVRSAIATERQKKILRGDHSAITTLSSMTGAGSDKVIFDAFAGDTTNPVLEYPLKACEATTDGGCWYMPDNATYRFNMPVSGYADFNLTRSRFNCKDTSDTNCKLLTQ